MLTETDRYYWEMAMEGFSNETLYDGEHTYDVFYPDVIDPEDAREYFAVVVSSSRGFPEVIYFRDQSDFEVFRCEIEETTEEE